jgi:hypothetical protein
LSKTNIVQISEKCGTYGSGSCSVKIQVNLLKKAVINERIKFVEFIIVYIKNSSKDNNVPTVNKLHLCLF